MSFDPAALFASGQAGAWYDPSDLSTLWQDTAGTVPVAIAGQPVARIDDKSGNARHLIQASAAQNPTYQIDGSGKSYLLFDGVDDVFNVNLALSMSFDRMSAIRQVSWTGNDRIFAGSTSVEPRLYQASPSPSLAIYAGTAAVAHTGLAVGTNGVVTERFIAGGSKIAVNNGAYVTGNVGSTALTVLRVGASSAAGGSAANFRLYGLILRAGSLSDEEVVGGQSWLAEKSGVLFATRRMSRHSFWC